MHIKIFICALFFSLISAALGALRPLVIADLLVGQSTSQLVKDILDLLDISLSPILILLFLEIFDFALLSLCGILVAFLASNTGKIYRYRLIDAAIKSISLPSTDYLARHIGFLKTYVDTIEIYFRHSLVATFSAAAQLLIAFYITMSINSSIAIILVLEIFILVLVTILYSPVHAKNTKRHMLADESMLSNNSLNSRKGFSIWFGGIAKNWRLKRFSEIDEVARSRRFAWIFESIYYNINTAVAGFFIIIGYYFIIELNNGSKHDFAALLLYCGLMLAPVMKLASAFPEYKEYMYAKKELSSFIDNSSMVINKDLNLLKLSFVAKLQNHLSDSLQKTISIGYGSRLALVGRSGSGKTSTLLGLLGAHSEAVNDIFVAGKPINIVRPLLPEIGIRYLSDTPVFESGTVLENCNFQLDACINLSKRYQIFPNFSEADYSKFFDKFIEASGEPLSLGERQRVQLLRTLLHKPKVIILDEALSGIEEELEFDIVNNLISDKSFEIIIYSGHRIGILSLFDFRINLN